MDWYPFAILAWRRHTRGLSPLQKHAYRQLIDEYMHDERPLPSEPAALAEIAGIPYSPDIAHVVTTFFNLGANGLLHHTRCDTELAEWHERREKHRVKSSEGGKAKAAKSKAPSTAGKKQAKPRRATGVPGSATVTGTKTQTEESPPDGGVAPDGATPRTQAEIDEELVRAAAAEARATMIEARQTLFRAWNNWAARHGAPEIETFAGQRLDYATARIREHGIDNLLVTLEYASESPYCIGRTAKGRPMTFDQFVQLAFHQKLREGNYHDRAIPGPGHDAKRDADRAAILRELGFPTGGSVGGNGSMDAGDGPVIHHNG